VIQATRAPFRTELFRVRRAGLLSSALSVSGTLCTYSDTAIR